MARKNDPANDQAGQANGVFDLVKGRRITVPSSVRSLKVPTGPSAKKVDVDPKYLHVGDDLKGDYKFTRSVTIPCLPNGITDENLMESIAQLLNDLKAYDAAQEITATVTVKHKDGTKEDREIRGPRTLKICAEYDKNGNLVKELPAAEYMAKLIMGELVLGIQKRFYKQLQPKALEAAYNGELGTRTDAGNEGEAFERPPVKAARVKKTQDEEMEEITLG